jgi:acyl transferase domain-containing protein
MSVPSAGSGLSAVKLALVARQRRGSEDASLLASEPIAVIGMGCRLPGGATSPDRYWDLLRHGVDAVGEVPADRWDAEALYDADRSRPGKVGTRQGSFLPDVDRFDPAFFGIAPREAAAMDPQQRLLLEVAWEALEDGGQTADHLAGSRTGVFIASYNDDYARRLFADPAGIDAYTLSGTSHSIASGRISFLYDLRGPSITVDTACSASLVAVHLACQSLRNGESDLALTGGVSLVLDPEGSISMSKWGMLAPDGRSKAFDASADGFGRGEGCGVVVLKRLADALADGDRIRAVIRGTAVNQDGRSAGLTAPNGLAQQDVVRAALQNARVDPGRIGLIEAHGTGTALGDPIEAEALVEAMGRAGEEPCALGSVKTNFGHLEAAAGVAGLIKLVLSLEREAIPPHLHFRSLNPHISLEGSRFYVPRELRPWPRGKEPRFAGVSSFGFGGTNAHIVLEEAPLLPAPPPVGPRAEILTLSAHTPPALVALACDHAERLSEPSDSVHDICFTAAVRRSHHAHRLAVVGEDAGQLRGKLAAFVRAGGASPEGSRAPLRIAFVFSGQGPQWWAMGRELLEAEPAFRKGVDACDEALRPHTGWSVLSVLRADEATSQLALTEFAQPALFTVQMGLAALWRSLGVVPRAVVGHSVGEIAAACTAGALTLEQGARVVAHRGKIMQRATGLGKMAAVDLAAVELGALLADLGAGLSLAAVNGPAASVVSGEAAALQGFLEHLSSRGVSWKRLPVDYAFHSAQMEPFRAELEAALQGLLPTPTTRPMVSTVTGDIVPGPRLDAGYWAGNMRQPVLFAPAIERLIAQGHNAFVEIAPHPVLSGYVVESGRAASAEVLALPSLRRGQPERASILGSLGSLYTRGATVEWTGAFATGGRCVTLPAYPWQRERFWFRAPDVPAMSAGTDTGHRFLGRRLRSPLAEAQFEALIDGDRLPYLADHEIFGTTLLPATAVLEAAHAAAALVMEGGACRLEAVAFDEPLVLASREQRVVQLVVTPPGAGGGAFELFSQAPNERIWTRHARGEIVRDGAPGPAALDVASVTQRLGEPRTGASVYEALRSRGLAFGPRFQAISRAWLGDDEVLARLESPKTLGAGLGADLLLPPLLDACLQGLNALPGAENGGVDVPIGVDHFRILDRGTQPCWSHALLRERATQGGTSSADVTAFGEDGRPVAEWRGLRLKRVNAESLAGARRPADDPLYEVAWRAASPRERQSPGGRWLVLEDGGGTGAMLAEALDACGARSVRARRGTDYSQEGPDRYTVNPDRPEQLARVLEVSAGGAALAGVACLWPLDSKLSEDEDATRVLEALRVVVGTALRVAQSVARVASAPRLYFVTRGAQAVDLAPVDPVQSSLWGLRAALALEHPELRATALDLDPRGEADEGASLAEELLADDREALRARRQGARYAARLVRSKAPASPAATEPPVRRLVTKERGVLDRLAWQDAKRVPPGPGQVEIRVHATGLNFRDVMNALGLYPGDPGALGDECSGVVAAVGPGVTRLKPGDEVMAFAPGAFASYVTTASDLAVPKPPGLSLTDAAGIPIAFLTAEHALVDLAELASGQSVLIHAAAGGVGLAAVEIARRRGATIFGTAGSDQKRDYLRSIGVEHVMDSRSLDFADAIMAATGGRGVDVVLNSLAGDFIARSLGVLRRGGCFLEIGRTGIWTPEQVAALGRDLRYYVVFLGSMREHEASRVRAMLTSLSERLGDGRLTPVPVRAFRGDDAVEAFRFMSQARQIGKIVVSYPAAIAASATAVRGDAAYLVTGGLGGAGLAVAQALAASGARHLVLAGRRAPSEAALHAISGLERAGVRVLVLRADVSREDEVSRLLDETARALPPLRGVVHAAGVLDDGPVLDQDWSRFARVLAPKALGAWNLDRLTRGADLDFFCCFSSLASWIGWAGQSTYGAANAFVDGLARRRRNEGRPAISLAFGPWADVGMAAGLSERDRRRLEDHGLRALPPARAAALAVRLFGASSAGIAVADVDWDAYASHTASPLLAELLGTKRGALRAPAPEETFPESLRAVPESRRRSVLLRRVEETAARILGADSGAALDPGRPLRELGLDSLMAVEVRNALAALVRRPLPATLLFEHPTLDALTDYLLRDLAGAVTPTVPGPEPEPLRDAAEVGALSEAEAEALLVKELEGMQERDRG